ncbi:MAG: glutamine--tRNA ligase/YqeY domain fusion protein [Deltaproteobacteria bacterium]|jgi:glutaminyl-tRNA synthetase|nr:glutamine--tRNA ligase/YqeY domain fusion protein [Deltaproteobacteria bacterium]
MADNNKNEFNIEHKKVAPNFITEIIDEQIKTGKNDGRIHTRFPPEPNGYLHIGHAKAICLNFGIAADYKGKCNLRFDDTNPLSESDEYVQAIKQDVSWLGFDWEDRLYFASDYFDQMYEWAVYLIKEGKAYVDSLSVEEFKDYRGDYNNPGKPSPYRDRTVDENLDLFKRMKNGEFGDGEHVLRAKIDMTNPNMNMRDPALYRIKHASHHNSGDKWCIYPMYDYAHELEDALEHITHSLCTLEFEDHRPIYNWVIENTPVPATPQQIEFARLNLTYTVMSKRKLARLVEEKIVDGWDDPRLPTISGLRRRGYSPSSIRKFCNKIGIAKRDSIVDIALLEHTLREDLNATSPRVMAVLDPLKIIITNYPEDKTDEFDAPYFPDKPEKGSRKIPFSREIYIEREDFKEKPPRKWHRLAPGREIRLRYACLITCNKVVKDPETGEVKELHCTWDPESKGGTSPDGRKVRGTSHWVSAKHCIRAKVRKYDRLFNQSNPLVADDFLESLNPESLEVLENCYLEPSLVQARPEERYQFERLGYYVVDRYDSTSKNLVFNQTVTLRDTWAKIERAQQRKAQQKKKQEKKNKYLDFKDFTKVDLRVGKIVAAATVEGADRLLKLQVDLGEAKPRQVMAGIRESYSEPSVLIGKQVVVVANLKPRKMKFGVSEAMILSCETDKKGEYEVSSLELSVKPGTKLV